MAENAGGEDQELQAVILAAGYGTRLLRDVERDETGVSAGIRDLPKPLLPVGGQTILERWMNELYACGVSAVVVVTNDLHLASFEDVSSSIVARNPLPNKKAIVVSNGTRTATSRHGAVADLSRGLKVLQDLDQGKGEAGSAQSSSKIVVAVAGDTLLVGTDLSGLLQQFSNDPCYNDKQNFFGVVGYELSDMSETSRRGMLRIEKDSAGRECVRALVEKPTPEESPSPTASMPIYFFDLSSGLFATNKFLSERAADPIEAKDAPGLLISWLALRGERIVLARATGRIDVGNLKQYRDALHLFQGRELVKIDKLRDAQSAEPKLTSSPVAGKLQRMATEMAVGRASARVALMGNPSDRYQGRVISFLAANCGIAEVIAANVGDRALSFVPSRVEDLLEFDGFSQLESRTALSGFSGALCLVQGACVTFWSRQKHRVKPSRCTISYSTTIPPLAGLAGSSALVLATLRCLCRFFDITESEFADEKLWPLIALDVETKLLDIPAGLQDRIVQCKGGVQDMDFAPLPPAIKSEGSDNHHATSPAGGDSVRAFPFIRSISPARLPDMYILYSRVPYNSPSSQVSHSLLGKKRERSDSKEDDHDSLVRNCTQGLRVLATAATILLQEDEPWTNSRRSTLADFMDENFAIRRKLVGDDAIGGDSLQLVRLAQSVGMGAKLTGSGGCVLCLPRNSEREAHIRISMEGMQGLCFKKVEIAKELFSG